MLFRLLCLCILFFSPSIFAAEIIKSTKNSVLAQFDPLEENFAIGDRLVASQDENKKALIEITKIKGQKFIARVLNGKVSLGMTLKKFGVVDEGHETNTANLETVTLRFASQYVFRGIPYFTTHIAGSIDYVNEGLLASVNIANTVAPGTSTVESYLGYSLNRINWTITPLIAYYTFFGNHSWDGLDFMLNLTYSIFAFDISYMPRYYGTKSNDLYFSLSMLIGIGPRWKLSPRIGHSQFSNENSVEFKNYQDFKLGIICSAQEFTAEFAFTGTNRQDLSGKKLSDNTAAILISKRF